MRWTRLAGLASGFAALAGCAAGYVRVSVRVSDTPATRPESSYFCYDCHANRYFDPYYDWCAGYGFRYRWNDHPAALAVYRERYVAIKRDHPDYGRYRYRDGYRAEARYRDPADYDAWKRSPGASPAKPAKSEDRNHKVREKRPAKPGIKHHKKDDGKKQDDGQRPPVPPGGGP